MFVSDVHSKQDKQQGKCMMGNERKRGKLDNLHFGKQAFLMKHPLFEVKSAQEQEKRVERITYRDTVLIKSLSSWT